MDFKKIIRGRALYTESDKIWVAQGMTFFAIDFNGKRVSKKYKVGSLKSKFFSLNRLSRQLLREGIHHLIPLKNNSFLVSTKRKVYIVNNEGAVVNEFTGFRGNKPGHQGICLCPNGTVFFGEYSLNNDRKFDTKLYRSIDNGLTFEVCLTLSKETTRHIHFVKYDHFDDALYLGTGDEDYECKLYKSTDNGNTWEIVGEGSQNWRAIGICIEKDYLLWGTDAGSVPDPNYIIRMDKKTKKLEILKEVEGPCHGCATFKNGKTFISTGVEGGQNETDKYSRLYEYTPSGIKQLRKVKKDMLPLMIQFGVMRFPLGTENCEKTVFTCYALEKLGEVVQIER